VQAVASRHDVALDLLRQTLLVAGADVLQGFLDDGLVEPKLS
jgi:hypothetical protein